MEKTALKRKRQLPEFKDLFNALFKLRDNDIQDRVLAAINGIIKDTCDCLCCKKELVDVGTQTEFVPAFVIKTENHRSDSMDSGVAANSPVHSDSNNGPEIKRRKRTSKVPRVEKSIKESSPFLARPKTIILREPQRMEITEETLNWINDYKDLDMISEPPETIKTKKELIELMKKEWVSSLKRVGGLLPLHKSIHENNYRHLKRQLYVLKQRKLNLNELYTDDNQSPLQYAITADSSTRIVEELLINGITVDDIDMDGNTVFHLAMLNSTNTNVLKLLLDKAELDLLLKTNHDGMTCLHIGVRENKFHMCKFLLEYMDEKLGLETNAGKNVSDENALMDLYIKGLTQFVTQEGPVRLNNKKMELINKTDIKQRRTALFYALNLESKLMMFMLLCHAADPRIAEHSGMDCINYSDCMDHFTTQIKCALRNTAVFLEKCEVNFLKSTQYDNI